MAIQGPSLPEVLTRVCSDWASVTVGSAGTLSGTADIGGARQFGLVMPSGYDTVTHISLAVSYDGATFALLKDAAGAEINIALGTSLYLSLATYVDSLAPWKSVKIYMGTAGTYTKQTSARTFVWCLK